MHIHLLHSGLFDRSTRSNGVAFQFCGKSDTDKLSWEPVQLETFSWVYHLRVLLPLLWKINLLYQYEGGGSDTRKDIFPEHRVPMRRMVISHQRANLWRLTFFFLNTGSCSPLCPSCFASPSEHIVPSPVKGGTFALFANTELQPRGFICPRGTQTIYIQRGRSVPSRAPPVPVPCSHEQLLHQKVY